MYTQKAGYMLEIIKLSKRSWFFFLFFCRLGLYLFNRHLSDPPVRSHQKPNEFWLITGIVLLDIQKVFGSVDHFILSKSFEALGAKLTLWFKSYLTYRSQRVNVNGVESDQLHMSDYYNITTLKEYLIRDRSVGQQQQTKN